MTNQPVDPQGNTPRVPDLGVLQTIINEIRLTWRLLRDARVPIWLKLVPPVTMLYVVSPLDFVPDWFIGLGQLDDLAALFVGFRTFVALCPPEIVNEHRLAIAGPGAAPPPPGQVIDGAYREVGSPTRDPRARP